jgi:hypothetical protein
MAGKNDVYVYQDPNDQDVPFKVRPGVAFGSAGKEFKIRNVTDYPVTLTFQDSPFEAGPNPPPIAADSSKVFHIEVDADGFYPYQATVTLDDGTTVPAQGESDPGVIIDP